MAIYKYMMLIDRNGNETEELALVFDSTGHIVVENENGDSINGADISTVIRLMLEDTWMRAVPEQSDYRDIIATVPLINQLREMSGMQLVKGDEPLTGTEPSRR